MKTELLQLFVQVLFLTRLKKYAKSEKKPFMSKESLLID